MKYKRIRELREENGLYQSQLANILNIAQTTYSNYELGRRKIPISVLINLAKFYNRSVDYLINLTENTKPYFRK